MSRSKAKRRLRRVLLGAIGCLYVLSIPWYRSGDPAGGAWFGLPDWVAVAIACYAAVAVLNSAAWLLSDVSDRDDPDEGPVG